MEYGGLMAIIIDNKENESAKSLVMRDDGTGQNVKIPSFLIGLTDGAYLKDAVHKTEQVQPKYFQNRYKSKKANEAGDDEELDEESNEKSANRVIIQANINFASRSKAREDLNVEMWYSSIYEMMMSDWDMKLYSDILLSLQSRITF